MTDVQRLCADLERAKAEAAAMREALERLLGDKLPVFPCDHDVGVCYCKEIGEVEMVEAALSTSAGADLLAEVKRLREVEASKPSTTDWAFCPRCGGSLDTGWECVKCGADWRWVK